MTEDLLSEITKDTLRELGIPVLGDILAILRHAKKIFTASRTNAEN